MNRIINVLRTAAEAKKAKALLTLDAFDKNLAAIGDHTTGDLYENIESAYREYLDAKDELEGLFSLETELNPPQDNVPF